MIQKDYLEYLNNCYKEIHSFLKEKDIGVDHEKLQIFFEKTVTPYKYWLDEQKVNKDFDKTGLLDAIKKKYNLVSTKTGFKLPDYLNDKEEFKRLSDNMRMCGYEYSREEQEFVKREGAVNV